MSAALALVAHGALAAVLVQWHESSATAEGEAAIVVELAPLAVARPDVPADVAPGPEQVQADLSRNRPVETVDTKDGATLTDKAVPEPAPELAPPPDGEIAALPKRVEEPPPRQQEEHPPAPATTAPQVQSQEIAKVAAAPAQGAPASHPSLSVPSWQNRLLGLIERNKRYPAKARAQRQHGVVHLAFSIDREGRLMSSRIARSSGSPALDEETLALVQRAQPFPPPPAEIPGPQVSLTVPVYFNLQ